MPRFPGFRRCHDIVRCSVGYPTLRVLTVVCGGVGCEQGLVRLPGTEGEAQCGCYHGVAVTCRRLHPVIHPLAAGRLSRSLVGLGHAHH